ncbi:MAG: hypothetical protein MUC49_12200 [Raineya sp.]|jgi:hypothetical protein|nr:hypothetical protein [Raineya sp.]
MAINILKILGYSIGMSILMGIVFFAVGMFFEVDTRSTETVLKYDQKNKRYKEKTKLVEKDISGDTTAYFTMAGMLIGIILGVFLALDKGTSVSKTENKPTEKPVKKTPPKIP